MAYQNKSIGSFLSSFFEIVFLLFIIFIIRSFVFGLYQVPTGSMECTMLVGERFFGDKFTYLFRAPKRGEVIAFNDPYFRYSKNPLTQLYQRYIGFPWGPDNWTKRIIGEPGDTLKGVIEDGKPVIYLTNKEKNIINQKLEEPYVNSYPLIWIKKNIVKTSTGEKFDICGRSFDPKKPFNNQPFYNIRESEIYYDANGQPRIAHPDEAVLSANPNAKFRINEGINFRDESDEFFITLGKGQYWVMGDNRRGSKDSRWFGPISEKEIHGRILFRIWSIDSDESWWILDLLKHPIKFWKKIRWNRFFQLIR